MAFLRNTQNLHWKISFLPFRILNVLALAKGNPSANKTGREKRRKWCSKSPEQFKCLNLLQCLLGPAPLVQAKLLGAGWVVCGYLLSAVIPGLLPRTKDWDEGVILGVPRIEGSPWQWVSQSSQAGSSQPGCVVLSASCLQGTALNTPPGPQDSVGER